MSEGDERSFLNRWSQRKARARQGTPDHAEAPAPVKAGRMRTDRPTADLDAKARAASDPNQGGANGDLTNEGQTNGGEATVAQDQAPSMEDIVNTDFEALTYDSDYTRFMGADVPEGVRRKALRKLWASDPILANIDGLDDYCEDFSDAVWVDPTMTTDYKIGQGFLTDEEVAEWDALGSKPDTEASPPPLSIALEPADSADAALMIAHADAHAHALYPPESCHGTPVEDLLGAHVRFWMARQGTRPMGCVALVIGNATTAEIKRLWVEEEARRQGVAGRLMRELLQTARTLGVEKLQLETGTRQPEAVSFYRSIGFHDRGPFGAYSDDPLSVFMEKSLGP